MADARDAFVRQYFNEGLTYKDILFVMKENHDISMSLRHLHRVLRRIGLRRRVYSDIEPVIDFVLGEIEHSAGHLHGYRMMRQRCLANGLSVRTEDVSTILRVCDPLGVELRTARRFTRRNYSAPGPNFIWHIDGYDKLKPFGLCIHGCICGYSRKVIWLNVFNTNNNPRVIAGYFLETVEQCGGTARMIRGDFGTENVLVKRLQNYFKRNDPGNTGYIEGASTQNQRIECWWGHLRRNHMQHWMDIFKQLQGDNEFSGSRDDKSLVQFCFMPLIQRELDLAVTMWNRHTIRRSRNSSLPSGQPNRIYNFPELCGTRDYMWSVSNDDTDACRDDVVFRSSVCCDPDIYELCINILAEDDIDPPNTADQAIALYKHIRTRMSANI